MRTQANAITISGRSSGDGHLLPIKVSLVALNSSIPVQAHMTLRGWYGSRSEQNVSRNRRFIVLALTTALAGIYSGNSANATGLGFSRGLGWGLERIQFLAPALGPFSHARFCVRYPEDCKVQGTAFRDDKLALTDRRWADLMEVNAEVNRTIRPEHNSGGAAAEVWLISPKAGDCSDYAVTKRHELLARGWPSWALLLAEVVTSSSQHHLVVVVRTEEGDLVIDNLNANIRPWFKTQYQWVRIQSPMNPMAWSTVAAVSG